MIGRRPIRSESAPARGETIIGVPKNGSSRNPVETGEYPRANWNSWMIRNAAAKVAPDIRNIVTFPTANARLRNSLIGTIGARTRCSHHDERHQQRGTGHERADDLRARPSDVVRPHEGPDQCDDARGYERNADEVDPLRGTVAFRQQSASRARSRAARSGR